MDIELRKRLLQVRIMFLFQREYDISDDMFEELDKEYGILAYIYEYATYFEVIGDESILGELSLMLEKKGYN